MIKRRRLAANTTTIFQVLVVVFVSILMAATELVVHVHCQQYDNEDEESAVLPMDTDGIVPRESVSCPTYQGPVAFGMSKEFISKAHTAWSLCSLLREEELNDPIKQATYDRFVLHKDYNDATLIVQTKGDPTCYVAFQGTAAENPWDVAQNFYPIPAQLPNSDCMVRGGFERAYYGSFYDDYRQSLTECVESCDSDGDNNGCPIVLTGHSQGGGLAVIASLELKHLNPATMTFGGMRTILLHKTPCTDMDTNRHFRFQNTRDGFYDSASMSRRSSRATQVGHALYLHADNGATTSALLYTHLDEDDLRSPMDLEPHRRVAYTESLENLLNHECDPVPVGKWEESMWCGYDDECSSNMCIANACTDQKQESGSFCEEDHHCIHGACLEGLCTSSTGLLDSGLTCTQHSSCSTGRCNRLDGMCADKLAHCDSCQDDEDCSSGNCGWKDFQRICVPEGGGLLEEGCRCNWDQECKSGMCSGIVFGRKCE